MWLRRFRTCYGHMSQIRGRKHKSVKKIFEIDGLWHKIEMEHSFLLSLRLIIDESLIWKGRDRVTTWHKSEVRATVEEEGGRKKDFQLQYSCFSLRCDPFFLVAHPLQGSWHLINNFCSTNLQASVKVLRPSVRDGSWNLKIFSKISRYFPVISLWEPLALERVINICFTCAAILFHGLSHASVGWGG